MSIHTRTIPKYVLALALAFVTLAPIAFVHVADAQIIRDHRTPPIVRDHRAKLCRVGYDPYPDVPSNLPAFTTCGLPANSTAAVGSFCSCMVLIQGHYVTVGGSVVLASSPNG